MKNSKGSGFMARKANLLSIRILSVIAFILVMVVNSLANTLPINGRTTGEISDMYPNLFVPTGLTFSIWGVIYLFLLSYTFYQTGLFRRTSSTETEIVKRIGWLYVLSCIANISWILCWHYDFILLSVLVMLVLLVTLIIIYQRTRSGKGSTFMEKLFISAPFSLYLGWITVATIANITALLVDIKWDGWGISPVIWTSIVILVAIGITLLIQKKFKDILFSLVVIWALIGILIRHIDLYESQYPFIIGVVCIGIIAVGVGVFLIVFGKKSLKF